MATAELRMIDGPGKFEGELWITQLAYDVSLEGGCDAECGESDSGGWYGLLKHGHTIFADDDVLNESLTDSEREYLLESAGCILREDSQGFVYGTWYEDMEKLDADWLDVEKEVHDALPSQVFLRDVESFLGDMDGEPSTGFWTCPECGEDKDFDNCDGCSACGLSVEDLQAWERNEFSASTCDSCGSHLGGDRHSAIGWAKGAREAGFADSHRWEGEICTDCLLFFANGDLPEDR